MDALDQRVDGEDEIVAGPRAKAGSVVLETEAAFAGDGSEEAGDEAVFRRSLRTHGWRLLIPSPFGRIRLGKCSLGQAQAHLSLRER